jgi:magnesium-protoporphyrin IX monomethyl ester (oxidative) cyclase
MLDRPRTLGQKLKEIPRSFEKKAWARFFMVTLLPPKLWCRFFLLSVFATMYLNDIQRSGFYKSLGLDAREFDIQVIKKTNETSARVFPILLDVEHPDFYRRLDICIANNDKLTEIAGSNRPKPLQLVQKLPLYFSNIVQLVKLFLLPTIDSVPAGQVL